MLEHFSNANSQNTEIYYDLMSSSSVLEMLMMSGDVKPEPDDHIIITDSSNSLWPSDDFARILNYGNVSEFHHHHHHLPRTISCPPNMALIESNNGRESFKKRKADERSPSSKVAAEEKSQEKKLKGCCVEGDQSKITKQYNNSKSTNTTNYSNNSNTNKNNDKESADTNIKSKENLKASEAPKPDYIHVRARRGQATDSHSLAERVRREKISERMRYLQDLVPGCNKVTGKAGMLDEIINYVQSLQKQVEFLSMKLAAMNPSPIDFDVDSYLGKEVYTSNIPTVGASSSSANSHHHQLQFNELMSSQGNSCSNMGTVISNNHHQDFTTLGRTTSAPVSLIPDAFLDSPCLNLPWDDDLQNLYSMELQQGRSTTAFMSQQFTGFLDAGHVKQEMRSDFLN